MVSLFGERPEDLRDYRMGLAGLMAGLHALRIVAERGPATTDDMLTASAGIRQVLDTIPPQFWREGEREQLDQLIFKMTEAARDREIGRTHG